MLKVGIYAPYAKNEVTLAAVQFADWLVRCGLDVDFMTNGKVNQGVHAVWDKKVRRVRNVESLYRWAHNATHLCWFAPDVFAFDAAKLVMADRPKRKTKNFFFPHWCNWSTNYVKFFQSTKRTICLAQEMAIWLDAKYPDIDTKRTWANLVSPAIPLICKQGFVEPESRSLLVLFDRSTVLDVDLELFDLFDLLLQNHPHLKITFAFVGALPTPYRDQVRSLKFIREDRVFFANNPDYTDYLHLARQHDWIYLATTRHQFGSLLSHLQITTVPIICHDIPPVGGHIVDKKTGYLIPCGLHEKPFPLAEINAVEVYNKLDDVFMLSETELITMQTAIAQQLKKKQAAFEQFIMKEFVL